MITSNKGVILLVVSAVLLVASGGAIAVMELKGREDRRRASKELQSFCMACESHGAAGARSIDDIRTALAGSTFTPTFERWFGPGLEGVTFHFPWPDPLPTSGAAIALCSRVHQGRTITVRSDFVILVSP